MSRTGLVLEGGGMRGLYTAGVLDVFMENGIRFDGLIGVSAGAIMGTSFASGQTGRSIRYYKKYCGDPRFMSFRNFLKYGDIVDEKFGYHDIPEILDPFDYEAFAANPMEYTVVVTDMADGKAVYHTIRDMRAEMPWLQASATLPYVSRPVEISGGKYVDGGCSDSIPFRAMMKKGYDRIVVIRTRDREYRKKAGAFWLPAGAYPRNPEFAKSLRLRFSRYNRSVGELERKEESGEIFVIAPSIPLTLKRIEKDPNRLQEAYDLGRLNAEKQLPAILEYMGKLDD